MSAPTRFSNGVTNVGSSNPLGQYGLPDPTKWHTYFNDFDAYTTAVTTMWTETKIGTGTVASTALDGGCLLITNSAADNDSINIQRVAASYLLSASKRAIFKSRFKISDVLQSDLFVGLAVVDTILLSATAGDGVTDGIFFQKDDGAATLDFYCQKDTTTGQNSATSVATLVNDTFVSVAWYYDGAGNVSYYIDDVKKGTISASSTYLPDVILTDSIAFMNGEAVAKNMTVDYIFAALER